MPSKRHFCMLLDPISWTLAVYMCFSLVATATLGNSGNLHKSKMASESEKYLLDPHKKFIQSNNEKYLGAGDPY